MRFYSAVVGIVIVFTGIVFMAKSDYAVGLIRSGDVADKPVAAIGLGRVACAIDTKDDRAHFILLCLDNVNNAGTDTVHVCTEMAERIYCPDEVAL